MNAPKSCDKGGKDLSGKQRIVEMWHDHYFYGQVCETEARSRLMQLPRAASAEPLQPSSRGGATAGESVVYNSQRHGLSSSSSSFGAAAMPTTAAYFRIGVPHPIYNNSRKVRQCLGHVSTPDFADGVDWRFARRHRLVDGQAGHHGGSQGERAQLMKMLDEVRAETRRGTRNSAKRGQQSSRSIDFGKLGATSLARPASEHSLRDVRRA